MSQNYWTVEPASALVFWLVLLLDVSSPFPAGLSISAAGARTAVPAWPYCLENWVAAAYHYSRHLLKALEAQEGVAQEGQSFVVVAVGIPVED